MGLCRVAISRAALVAAPVGQVGSAARTQAWLRSKSAPKRLSLARDHITTEARFRSRSTSSAVSCSTLGARVRSSEASAQQKEASSST